MPLLTIVWLYKDHTKNKIIPSFILIFQSCLITYALNTIIGEPQTEFIDEYTQEMYDNFSSNIYSYKYNFLDNIIKSIKDVYVKFISITKFLEILIIMIVGNIYNVIFEEGTLLSFIESLIPIIILIIYYYRYIECEIDWTAPNQMPKATMLSDLHNNTYINRNYSHQAYKLIALKSMPKKPSKIPWILLSLIISCILGILNLYRINYDVINEILNTKKLLTEALSKEGYIIWNVIVMFFMNPTSLDTVLSILNPVQIIMIWIYFNDFADLLSASINVLKNWDLFASVIRIPFESNNLKSITSVNNISLNIDKYIYFDIPDELIESQEDLLFERKFNEFVSFGNIKGAEIFANQFGNPKIKEFCIKALNDSNNLLIKDINISFNKNCNSFVVGTQDNKDVTISLLSNEGRIVYFAAESGKGKSTINNLWNGDTRFLSTFFNGHCGSLILDSCKYLNPYYSQQYEMFLDSLSVLDNLQIADLNASLQEIKYFLDHTEISKYYNKLNNLFGLTKFSSGQKDRIKMCRLFTLMNHIIKESLIENNMESYTISALSSNDKNLELIRQNLKLKSFFVTLDEPFGSLDYDNAMIIMELLNKYKQLGFTIVITDHSKVAEAYADDMIKIENKTCKYYTKVNGEFVDCSELKFDDTNTLIIGNTIVCKDVNDRTKHDPFNIMSELQKGTFKGIDTYKLPQKDYLLQCLSASKSLNYTTLDQSIIENKINTDI